MSTYRFRNATVADLKLLGHWQRQPHVSAWWGSEQPYDAADLEATRVARWIVLLDDQPFAYMQDYTVHGWDDHHFAHLPRGTRGIDQYIGVSDMLGKGHGPRFIAERMRTLFSDGAPMIATDPHPDNARAIAAYRKLGFIEIGPAQETAWGLILPMVAERPEDH